MGSYPASCEGQPPSGSDVGLTTPLCKDNSVTKTKPQIRSRTDPRKRQKQEKGHEFWIATWNVLSLYRAGALASLVGELDKYKVRIAALQEIRWRGTDVFRQKQYTIFYSGHTRNTLGTGFAVARQYESAVIGFKAINERLCTIRMKGQFFNTTIINAHAPTEDTDDEAKERFYEELERAYDDAPRHDIKIILGDMNAKVGKETIFRPTIGTESLHTESNDNGVRLVEFAISKGMTVSSTKFPHKNVHKATWQSPDGITQNQIDHVLIDTRHGSDILDVRSYRGADVDSDHFLVRAKCRQRISVARMERGTRRQRFNGQKLVGGGECVRRIREEFACHLKEQLVSEKAKGQEATDIEGEWRILKAAVTATAEEVVGFQQVERRDPWFNDECKVTIEERNEARKKMLQRETRANCSEYSRLRAIAKSVCRREKRKWEKKKVEEIQDLARRKETRKMYSKISEEKKGFQARTSMCNDKEGNLMVEGMRVVERWAEHFEELLNGTNGSGVTTGNVQEQVETDPDVIDPSLRETEEAISSMKNHKAPGEDMITAEIFKYGGDELKRELHDIITRIWQEEQMPREWGVALICPIHKKGSKLECANYRGISLLNIGYKILTKLITKRLGPYAEKVLGDYQCGFRSNRSTTDHIFTIRTILEKCYEFDITVHQLFIDYKQAYDSVDRDYLYETLDVLGVPKKLTKLVRMTLDNST